MKLCRGKPSRVKGASDVAVWCVFFRVVDNEIFLTMDDGRNALKALELDGKEVKIW